MLLVCMHRLKKQLQDFIAREAATAASAGRRSKKVTVTSAAPATAQLPGGLTSQKTLHGNLQPGSVCGTSSQIYV